MAECPGIYVLTQAADGLLARVRLPGGRLHAGQARGLADAARRLGNGVVELTGRANLQLRGLSAEGGAGLARELAPLGLAVPAEADRRRNILADPLAGLDPEEVLDVSRLVAVLDGALTSHSGLGALSPKFSFGLDGGGRSATLAHGHDLGVRAERGPGGVVCRLSLDGRSTPWGVPVEGAVAALVAGAEAVARLGPKARMRGLLGGHGHDAALRVAEAAAGPLIPLGAAEGRQPSSLIGAIDAWPGTVAFGLAPPTGSLDAGALEGLAELAESFGDGTLRLTPARSVLLGPVPTWRVPALEAAGEALGCLTRPTGVTVAACSGRACARGSVDARGDGAALARLFMGRREPAVIHVSACVRGCAHPGPADLLALARADGRYDLYAHAGAQARGTPLLEAVPSERLGQAVSGLLAPLAA